MTSANRTLNNAKSAKKDEFYTQYDDIEDELNKYRRFDHFKDKVVLCNCDDPEYSNFYKHFKAKFNIQGLELSKLIATHYNPDGKSYKLTYTQANGVPTEVKTPLKGDGDFRSPECIELLKEADIVVTNPPFSLFREYIAQLIEHNKKFLIMANINAITYKEIFPLIKENKIWFGHAFNKTMKFAVPEDYYTKLDERDYQGRKLAAVPGITWFTNLDNNKRHETLHLAASTKFDKYPKYDNYDAVEVSRVVKIPYDYRGAMGVPITFLGAYNPDQFEIIGATESEGKSFSNGLWDPESKVAQPMVNGKRLYKRIFIRNKHPRDTVEIIDREET